MSSTTKSKKRRRRSVAQFSSSTNTTKSDTPDAASDASVATPDRDAGVSGLTGTPDEQSAPRSGKRRRIAVEDVASSRSLRSSCTAKGKEAAERLLLAGEQSQQQPTVHSSLSSTRPRQSRRHIVARSIPSTQAERSRASEATADASNSDLGAAPFAVVKASENRNSTQSRKRRRLSNEDSALGGSVRGSCNPQNAIAPQKGGDIDFLSPAADNPLESLLQQSFPYLEKNPLHTSSKATRPPKLYDTHMEENLRLKKIVILPGLLDALSDICDQYVKRVAGTGKDLSPSFPRFKVPSNEDIVDEKTLVKYFEQMHMLFSKVASGLLFGTDWQPVFSLSSQAAGASSSLEAAADAYLFIDKDASPLLCPQDRLDVALVEKYDLHNFVTWEFKNLGFGSDISSALEVMEGDFHWIACQERQERHDSSFSCLNQNHREDGKLAVTGRPTGPDSDVTADIIKNSKVATVLDQAEERPPKRIRKDVGWSLKKKVQYIIQQAWASAVARDSTNLVFSSGNEDCLGFRQRETQTLFVSTPIRPSDKTDPRYMKVHIGQYISAFEDAVNRARQLESGTLSAFAQSSLRLPITDRPNLPNATAAGLFDKYPPEVRLPPLNSYFDRFLDQSPSVDLRLHQHKLATTQYNTNTWTLTRFKTDSDSTGATTSTSLDLFPESNDSEVVFLDLEHLLKGTSRIRRVYLGVAHGADGEVDYFPEPLVLKMSRDANEGSALKTEGENYQRLWKDGVRSIPKCHGIFSCQINPEDRRYFLLLENCGTSIARRTDTALPAHAKKYRETYESALMSLHSKGYTHNNITEDHVLMNTSKKVTFISLKDCGIPDTTVAAARRQKDSRTMALCLENPLKGQLLVSNRRVEEGDDSQETGSGSILQADPFFVIL